MKTIRGLPWTEIETDIKRDRRALAEAAHWHPNRRQPLLGYRSAGHRGKAIQDISLGVTCGLAALGMATVIWMGTGRHLGDANGVLVADAARRGVEPADTVTVRVTAYGSLRSVIGVPSTQVSVSRGTIVAVLAERLADQFPGLAPMAMLAVDGGNEMLPLDGVLTDGQSVELIPSMAGG